jgi:LPXTG-motif cell wall-anchored protein
VTFEFKIGEPPEIEVSFDTGGKTDAPSPVTVEKGTSLGTVDQPDIPEITEADGVRYKLDGWYDENGTPWEDVKVSEPVTMYAKWLIYIDQIDVTFVVPALGDKITDAAVPEDAPYYILEQYCSDPNYDTVDEASSEGEYTLNLSISLKDPDVSTFALEKDEWDFYNYIGDATINGENVDEPDYSEELYYGMSYNYDESGEYVRVEYYFPVTDEEYENEAEGVIDNDGATAYDDAGGEQPPKTGDTSDPVTSAILLVLSIIALSSLFITKKRSA